ncbi:unnamed protein product [Diatraea saccharalis]|uniref:Uncharacterized protein n=1 Tax=Diatraea saccharalis TaxID=40085 RepID=A0A9N9QWL2_9NEOP|nr:unnamed protein product [Diatraea saccharalis]
MNLRALENYIKVTFSQFVYPGQTLITNSNVRSNAISGGLVGNALSGGIVGGTEIGSITPNGVSSVVSNVNPINLANNAIGGSTISSLTSFDNSASGVINNYNGIGNTIGGITTISGLPGLDNTAANVINNYNGIGNLVSSNGITDLSMLNTIPSGPFLVNSYSPISPNGITIVSENSIDGYLNVAGKLPYLSVVSFEGALPSTGSGIATCGCGSGGIGIINDGLPITIGNANYGVSIARI